VSGVPDIAFGKDPLVDDHGAVCVIGVPTDKDSILARVYRIYEDGDIYRCTWQMAVKRCGRPVD